MTAEVCVRHQYDFGQFAPRGDFTDESGRAWSFGHSAGPRPVTPPATPVTDAEYQAQLDVIEARFGRAVREALWQMTHLGKRVDGGMTPPEVADTVYEWLQDVMDDCRVDRR